MNALPFKSFAALALLLSAAPAIAAESVVLAPSTPWKVDYAKQECRLLRTFGTGDDAVTMRLARGSGVQSFDMVIAGARVPRLGDEVKVTMKLEPQDTLAEFDGYSMGVPNRTEKFIRWYDGSPEILAGITNDQQVRLLADKKLDVVMHWSDGKAALEALQTCHDDLLRGWGANIDEIRALKVQPKPVGSPGRWATNADYPSREMHREIQGTVTFQLKLGTDGAVENCVILLSSDSAALDEQSCKLMRQRAKFAPARDADGKPVTSFYVNRIRWQIPR
jgi:TonB family protein